MAMYIDVSVRAQLNFFQNNIQCMLHITLSKITVSLQQVYTLLYNKSNYQ